MNAESSRTPETMAHVWPGCPTGLTVEQARAWWITNRKPRTYQLERFFYVQKTGSVTTIGREQ